MTPLLVNPEPLVPSLDIHQAAAMTDPESDLERRWSDWLAKGRVHDARMRRRMHWVGWLTATGIVSWPAWAPALLNFIVALDQS